MALCVGGCALVCSAGLGSAQAAGGGRPLAGETYSGEIDGLRFQTVSFTVSASGGTVADVDVPVPLQIACLRGRGVVSTTSSTPVAIDSVGESFTAQFVEHSAGTTIPVSGTLTGRFLAQGRESGTITFTYQVPPQTATEFGCTAPYTVSGSYATSAPRLGKTGVVKPVSGSVTVERPDTHRFVTVSATAAIPFGSTVNATHGRVTLETATRTGSQHATFYGGQFKLTQAHSGQTKLALNAPLSCRAHAASASQQRPPRSRRLWGQGHGDFTTIGSYASVSVLGTKWLTVDTCTSTTVTVATGEVRVTDFITHQSTVLHARHSIAVLGQSASSLVTAKQFAGWETLDAPFMTASSRFENALFAIRASAAWNSGSETVADVRKPCLALVPALEAFDSALQRLGLTGKTETDAQAVLTLNGKLLAILENMTIAAFKSQFDVPGLVTPWPTSLEGQYLTLQAALAKDLGLPASQVVI